ncbi:MAG: LptF/LptG family permease [Deltaproteobacteria bacterium]|nr:LptF/LptG family permease [Deltaproteobacteria bacterium]
MSTVSLYLVREFAAASTGVFLAILVTWLSADSLLHVGDVSDQGAGALRTVLLRSLDIFPLGVPTACVIGAVWSLSRAVRFREITAIRAGGIPLKTALLPILLVSLAVAGALALFEDRALVPARQSLLSNGDDETGRSNAPRQLAGRWWHATGTSILSAGSYSAETGALHDVTVFDLDASRQIRRRIDAEVAEHVDGVVWEFRGARVRDFEGPTGMRETVSASLRLDLGVTGAEMERAYPPIEATSLHKLARRIREHRGNESALVALEAAFHGRLAQPLAVVVLVLLALPFAIGDVERGDSLPRALLWALAASGAFWLVWTLALLVARAGLVPAALPVWGALLGFGALGAWRFRAVRE